MLKEDLISELLKIPDGTEVVLMDYRKNLHHSCADGTSEGLYSKYDVEMVGFEEIPNGADPFAVISFTNDEYEKDGTKID